MQKVSLILLLFVTSWVQAQFGPERIVSNTAMGAWSVFAADINGDSFNDILSASSFDDKISWFENLHDGMGNFGPRQDITVNLNNNITVYSSDLDGDNDMDVLATAYTENLVVWFENLDGQGSFSSQKIISSTTEGAYAVIAADINGDNQMDVISTSDLLSKVAWYENLDGLGNFSGENIITSATITPRSVQAADMDGDDDLDIVVASSGSVTVTWYENLDGQGNFGPQQVIAPAALAVSSVFTIDIDGDDDIDVLATTNSLDKVAWFENLDGLGNFGSENIITILADFALYVHATDLDNDNDIDVLSASASDDKIAWYENLDGQGAFGSQQIISINADSARSVYAKDLDNDGDMDVMSASRNDDKIAWYENLTILGVEDIENYVGITLHPNPAQSHVYIENIGQDEIRAIWLYDSLERLVLEEKDDVREIDISSLESGLFFLKVETKEGVLTEKVIKE